jgi:hypothetical protein
MAGQDRPGQLVRKQCELDRLVSRGSAARRYTGQQRKGVPGIVKPSCLGVLVVSTSAGRALTGRSATAAALTEVDRDAQMALPALCTLDR